MTLDYGNYGIFLSIGNAGFISSTLCSNFLASTVEPSSVWPKVSRDNAHAGAGHSQNHHHVLCLEHHGT